MKRKTKKEQPEEKTFDIERVDFNNRKTLDDGKVLVAVKWVGYEELTFEPIENVTEAQTETTVKEEEPEQGVVMKETKKRPAPVAANKEKVDKRRKNETKKEKTHAQIDYMSHSLMPDELNLIKEVDNQTVPTTGASLSTVAPATARRTNASRARRENISIEEQMHRSAEMRDIVAQNTQAIGEVKPNLCYSSTDESSKVEEQKNTPVATAETFVPVKPPPFIIMPPPVVSQVPSATMATMFPYNNNNSNHSKKDRNGEKTLENHGFSTLHSSKTSAIAKAMREENWEENSALENINDEGTQPPPGLNVCHSTFSTEMQERNYKAYGINSFFRDTQFAEDVALERKLMGVAVRNLCRVNGEQESNPEAIRRSMAQIENAGLGYALVSVHSLCASASQRKASQEPNNLLAAQFEYPLQWDLRCFYDQHRFTSIPIFIPLAFYPEREMVSFLSSICFCSFSCAKSWIRERGFGAHEQGSLAHRNEGDEIMLATFARKYFGITEEIKYAQSLLLHEDNGGPLNTKQWRALGTTHRSMLRQPLSVAAPSTIVAEVYVRSRKDAGKVARIVKRTEETHFNAIPERPEKNSADAAEAAKRKLKEGEGRPLKQRQTIDANGNRITLDDEQLEKRIQAGAVKRGQKKANPLTTKGMQVGAVKQAKLEPATKKTGVAQVTTFN